MHSRYRTAVGSVAAAFLVSAVLPIGAGLANSDDESPKDAKFYKLQWNLKAISAHATAFSSDLEPASEGENTEKVLVAVLDTGIDYTHPDLVGRVDLDRSESLIGEPADPRDEVPDLCMTEPYLPHESGVEADVREPGMAYGLNQSLDENAKAEELRKEPFIDFHSHGTAVAGLIASNGTYLAGVTSRTTLISIKVHGMGRQNCLSTYIEGIYKAADKGADVIHLSFPLEWSRTNPAFDGRAAVDRVNAALDYAHEKGAVLVAAAGNVPTGGIDLDANPAQFRFCEGNHVVCVSATGPPSADFVEEPYWDERAATSNFGTDIDVAAPGGTTAVPVWLTCSRVTEFGGLAQAPCRPEPERGYVWQSTGTSFGAAATSGLAALIFRVTGSDDPCVIQRIIEQSADEVGLEVDPALRERYFGKGRINVKEAVGLAGRAEWASGCD